MPSWIWVALYLFIGGMIATSFTNKKEEPDYGFVTVIMLFWPIVVVAFLLLAIAYVVRAFRGK